MSVPKILSTQAWMTFFHQKEPAVIMPGSEFKAMNPTKTFYKITDASTHEKYGFADQFSYKTGINKCALNTLGEYDRVQTGMAHWSGFTWPSHPDDMGESRAFYFIEKDSLDWTYAYYPKCNIREVEIMDDSTVCVNDAASHYQTNKFILGEKVALCDFPAWNDAEFVTKLIGKNPSMFSVVGEQYQTKELCEVALAENGGLIKHVRKDLLTEELCKLALRGKSSRSEHHRKHNVIITHDSGLRLKWVDDNIQTSELCEMAVSKHGDALQYVRKDLQTDRLCMIAVSNYGNAIRYVRADLITEPMCIMAIQNDVGGNLLKYIDEEHQTIAVCREACRQTGSMRYIKSHSTYYYRTLTSWLFGMG